MAEKTKIKFIVFFMGKGSALYEQFVLQAVKAFSKNVILNKKELIQEHQESIDKGIHPFVDINEWISIAEDFIKEYNKKFK